MNTPLKYHRESLLGMLRAGPTIVVFTKVDGTKRTMNCTLSADLIPTDKMPKLPENGEPIKLIKENLDVIRVFDQEKQEWRSFRIDSVEFASPFKE
jgi:hypothetical protein